MGNMNDTLTMLDKRVDYLEHKIKHEEDEARRYLALKNKRGIEYPSNLLH